MGVMVWYYGGDPLQPKGTAGSELVVQWLLLRQ